MLKQIDNQQQEGPSIHKALRSCNIEEVKKAIEKDRQNINQKDDRLGWVPIYKAVLYGDEEIVRLLLENGADPNLQNNLGDTPLILAIENSLKNIMILLLQFKANPNFPGPENIYPIHTACSGQKFEFVQILLQHGANPDAQNDNGTCPAHIAADNNDTQIMNILLDYKANICNLDKWGKIPEQYTHSSEMKNLLESKRPLEHQNHILTSTENIKKTKKLYTKEIEEKFDEKFKSLESSLNGIKQLKLEVKKAINGLKSSTKSNEKFKKAPRGLQIEISNDQLQEIEPHNINIDTQYQSQPNIPSFVDQIPQDQQQYNSVQIEKQLNFTQKQNEDQRNDIKPQEESDINKLDITCQQNNSQSNQEKNNSNEEEKDFEITQIEFQNIIQLENSQFKSVEISQLVKEKQNFEEVLNRESTRKSKRQIFDQTMIKKVEEDIQNIVENKPNKQQIKINEECVQPITISVWLRQIMLEQYLDNFIDNQVYENITLIRFFKSSLDWNKMLISLFGIDKYGHRQRIILQVLQDCQIFQKRGLFKLQKTFSNINMPSIQQWLKSINLQNDWSEKFISTGYENLEQLILQMTSQFSITDKILENELQIDSKNDRLKILNQLGLDSIKAANMEIPEKFIGEIQFECEVEHPMKCQKTCNIF